MIQQEKINTSNMRPETSELKSFRKSFSVCSTGEGHNYYMLFHFSTSGSVNTLQDAWLEMNNVQRF